MAYIKPAYINQQLLDSIESELLQLPKSAVLGIGLSAGADSAMLAVHSALVAKKLGFDLHCLHIHHGLQDKADTWLNKAHNLANMLGLPCHSRKLQFAVNKIGMEASARQARYAAIKEMSVQFGINHVLLAHHQNDQAETVLFRLLRGAGPLGLAAMSASSVKDDINYLRPWLGQPREIIMHSANAYAAATGWQFVRDPSNIDQRYARGVLRTEVAPMLDKNWPAWRSTMARHASQAQELGLLVEAFLQQAWAGIDPTPDNTSFALPAWRSQEPWLQVQLIRYWLKLNRLSMPSQARINEWLKQLRSVHQLGTDRNVKLKHGNQLIFIRHGRVCLEQDSIK